MIDLRYTEEHKLMTLETHDDIDTVYDPISETLYLNVDTDLQDDEYHYRVTYDADTATLILTGFISIPEDPGHNIGLNGTEQGFIFNGTHSNLFNVYYIPDASDRWFAGSEWDVYDNDVAWKDGGYYYGNAVKPKTFDVKCYYEEITIQERENIRRWLHRNKAGSLMFDNMPFVYWNVRPTKIIPGTQYNDSGKYSGTFNITFTAYETFGYLLRKCNKDEEFDGANDFCDLIDEDEMPDAPTTTDRTFNVYNPGREACGLTLRLSGTTSNPIEFLNTTNKSRCIIRQLPTNNLVLDINGDTGAIKTYIKTTPSNSELGYVYHDRGFVRLEPGMNKIDIMEKNSSGSWVTPTTLALTGIEVDYIPRIL